MAEVIEGLQALERLDPQTRSAIQASLDRTHPLNWPYVFRFHKAALGGAKAVAMTRGTAHPAAPPAALWGFPANEATGPPSRLSRQTSLSQRSPDGPRGTGQESGPYEARRQEASRSVASRPQPGTGSPRAPEQRHASPHGWQGPGDRDNRFAGYVRDEHPRDQADDDFARDAAGDDGSRDSSPPHWWPAGYHRSSQSSADYEKEHAPRERWERYLYEAIESLEAQVEHDDDKQSHALLRVLYAVAGRRDDALQPIPDVSEAEREFWINQMRGLAECLDERPRGSPDRRAAEAAAWLREAAGRLGELGALEVRNLAFCTAVHSFGSLARFAKYEFQPGEAVLLYAEIENFTSQPAKAGYHTVLKARLDLLEGPQRVHQEELPEADETCERQRRDFFVSYHVRLPATLRPGEYTLQLTIEDTLGRKTATRSIGLRIK